MTGKFLKKMMSAVMCVALSCGVFYSVNELADSVSDKVFANEISESEDVSAYVATISKSVLYKRFANPVPVQVTRDKLNRLDVMGKVMSNVDVVDPIGKVAVVFLKDSSYIDMLATPDVNGKVLGRFCADGSGVVMELLDGWTKLSSGDVTGYVNNEHILFGDDAQSYIDEHGKENEAGEAVLSNAMTLEAISEKERNESQQAVQNGQAGVNAQNLSSSYVLACIVHCESGNQSYEGQLAVANVVLNRVRSPLFPNTVAEVVYQKGQFTPAHSGSLARILVSGPSEMSIKAANDALAGNNNIGDFLYFNGYVDLSKVSSYRVIGDHTFYN